MTPEFECKCLARSEPCIGCRANAAIRDAVKAERDRWAAAFLLPLIGDFRREWLETAERLWSDRFDKPVPDGEPVFVVAGSLALLWVTRCRELLREMAQLQQNIEYLKSGEGTE